MIKKALKSCRNNIVGFVQGAGEVNRAKATGILEYEISELENIFSLLLFGSFIGLPSPPAHITLQLMPLMEDELSLMFEKIQTAHDPLGELAETLGDF